MQTLKSALLGGDFKPRPEDSTVALKNITFNVGRGEAFGVIGRNGSGKSSLLKIISGILKPTTGSVRVDGRVSALIELGAGFHPEISGRENIYINGIMLGLTRREIDEKYDRIVEFSGIREFIDQPVKTYSSGMYVRLGFAVAVHAEPDVLLIDEVLAVGDEEFAQRCIAKIQEMKYRGVTMLFVTHQLDQVRLLCDRALWLDHGEMKAIGHPQRVVDDYLQHVSGVDALPESTKVEPEPGDPLEEERWGSGEITIPHVRMVDRKGRQLVALGASAAVTIEMEVRVREPQTDFVFGVGIYHADGTCVYGTNTELEGFISEGIEAAGTVRFEIPSLDLVPGNYRIDAAVHTRNGRAFDYRRGVIRFVVGSPVHDVGVYRPPHKWAFTPAIRFRTTDPRAKNVPDAVRESLRSMNEESESDET